MPWTYATMLIGSLTLAGFPLLAGFWSKDEIIHAAFEHNMFLGTVGLVTALMTAYYTFRMVFKAFHGVTRVPEGVHAHESGGWILLPLCVLSIGAVFAGYAGVEFHAGGFLGIFEPHGWFHHFLAPVTESFKAFDTHHEATHEAATGIVAHLSHYGLMYASGALALIGIGAAYVLCLDSPMLLAVIRRAFPRAYEVLYNKYYVDEAYARWIVEPLKKFGRFCVGIDNFLIDGVVLMVTFVPRGLAWALRSMQQGALQGYAASMVAGLALLLVIVLVQAGT